MNNKLKFSVIIVFFFTITSCEKDEMNDKIDKESNTYEALDLFFYNNTVNSTKLSNKVEGKVSAIEEFSYKVDGNIYKSKLKINYDPKSGNVADVLVKKDFFKTSNISVREFQNNLDYQIMGGHSECIEGCKDKYTDENGDKISGRGACKANCWVDTIKDVIKSLAKIVPAL